MRKLLFYPKLSFSNLRKNGRYYVPFLISTSISEALFFIILSLTKNTSMKDLFGGNQLSMLLGMAMVISVFFFGVFLFYTQSFLIRQRKKEFGLYSVLGMSKHQLCILCFFELFWVLLFSTVSGILLGTLLSKLNFLLLLKLLKFNTPLAFQFVPSAAWATAGVFALLFMLLFLNSVRQLKRQNASELLSSESVGEKEPKTKWVTAVIGVLALGAGYTIALMVRSPMKAIALFTLAVILVMIGTYCLFSAGSIALLKALRKNKSYYYKPQHFISVSGMIYRMRRNAIGLGNICILATAVLVMISTTGSLYAGMESLLRNRYPRNIMVTVGHYNELDASLSGAQTKKIDAVVNKAIAENNVSIKNTVKAVTCSYRTLQNGSSFALQKEENFSQSHLTQLIVMQLSDYNRSAKTPETLEPGEVLVNAVRGSISGDTASMGTLKYHIKKHVTDSSVETQNLAYMYDTIYLIVPDGKTMKEINHAFGDGKVATSCNYEYSFDSDASAKTQEKLQESLDKALGKAGYPEKYYIVEGAESSRAQFYQIYGGFLFIGIFLGIICLSATVLTIYYKQLSEGYDDRARYAVMKKVGMDNEEIKKTIRSQVLIVFFLPVLMALIHMAFASPIILQLLSVLNLSDPRIYLLGLAVTIAAFLLLYALVYSLTAKAYYRIVSAKDA